MAKNVILKTMNCPSCGAPLKVEKEGEPIFCLHCENTVVPVSQSRNEASAEVGVGFSGMMKVEGLRTPSSALAYAEQLFEEYDWEAFSYAQALSITELDRLASSLKASSADDKNTWIVCFKTVSVPFLQKYEGCKRILSSVIEEYKKDNLDSYSKFDAYKRIASMVSSCKENTVSKLEKFLEKAEKYGASDDELSELAGEVNEIKNLSDLQLFARIEEIPEISAFTEAKNAKIVDELAAAGIHAESQYQLAKSLIAEKRYVEALNVLLTLKGYSDTNVLAEQIDKYFLLSHILEIDGNLYHFKKRDDEDEALNLYPVQNGAVSDKPIIKGIGQIITNYADTLYYLDSGNKLKRYSLSSGAEQKIYDKSLDPESIYIYEMRAYLLSENHGEYEERKHNLIMLDLATGAVSIVIKDLLSIVHRENNKIVYRTSVKPEGERRSHTVTNVLDVDAMEILSLGAKKIFIHGFTDDYVVYTQEAPNSKNKNLFVKSLNSVENEKLVEKNIFEFCNIIDGKLFYYVGNSRNKSLININCDGSGRKEWSLYISDVLFEQGGWLYFIRRAGYNSVLCKSRLDGSQFSIIASDIEKFIEFKNGYLYYMNEASTLVKIRMDGTGLQKLCDDVESVLSVHEDKIIFVSVDDRSVTKSFETTTTRIVKSIYAVDFSGSGKIKLAYDIKSAKEYDENTVYYITEKEVAGQYDETVKHQELYRLNVITYETEKLLELGLEDAPKKTSSFVIAMIVAAFLFFLGLICFSSDSAEFGIFWIMSASVTLLIGIFIKANKSA
ncbi:MAG: DUF5050 domain-containing protein [Ruminococcaceae bacterium]|nr:DUF5050 domain-containing protein [Oscillospiraceae bacterium]